MKRVKLDLEFIFKSLTHFVYQFITTPVCLVSGFVMVEITEDLFSSVGMEAMKMLRW